MRKPLRRVFCALLILVLASAAAIWIGNHAYFTRLYRIQLDYRLHNGSHAMLKYPDQMADGDPAHNRLLSAQTDCRWNDLEINVLHGVWVEDYDLLYVAAQSNYGGDGDDFSLSFALYDGRRTLLAENALQITTDGSLGHLHELLYFPLEPPAGDVPFILSIQYHQLVNGVLTTTEIGSIPLEHAA